jgi:hypothetical protein
VKLPKGPEERLPLFSAFPACCTSCWKVATFYTARGQKARRVLDGKHPPEDGPELHAPPELSEVLEADAVNLLEAAEQRLAIRLQARRSPHASTARRQTAHSPAHPDHAGNPVGTHGPCNVTHTRYVRNIRTFSSAFLRTRASGRGAYCACANAQRGYNG